MNFRRSIIALAAVGVLGGLPGPSFAHHSFAMFDQTSEKTIAGTVSSFDWTNPHIFIWVEVPNGAAVERWGIEGMSPNYLARRGWSKRSLNPGDKISLTIHPLRDGSHGGSFVKVVLPNGQTKSMRGTG